MIEPYNLPPAILAVIGDYYEHRNNPFWNKLDDMHTIFAKCRDHGWTCETTAGKFWMTKATTQVKVTEDSTTKLMNIVYSDVSEGKPFGAIAEFTEKTKGWCVVEPTEEKEMKP